MDFNVNIHQPHRSNYDDERKEEEKQKKEKKRIADEVIDDDEPGDYIKEDTYGTSRIHAWVFVQKQGR